MQLWGQELNVLCTVCLRRNIVVCICVCAEASARRVSPGGRGGPGRTFWITWALLTDRPAPTGNRTPLDRILGTRTSVLLFGSRTPSGPDYLTCFPLICKTLAKHPRPSPEYFYNALFIILPLRARGARRATRDGAGRGRGMAGGAMPCALTAGVRLYGV